jgi:serine/threonine-protein kinase
VGAVLLDRVRILGLLARGGMGKVYLGEQVGLARQCAVKVLDTRAAAAAGGTDFARRFLLEASTAAKLTHPNIVTVFDYGETDDGRCFIAMELLAGRTLAEELKTNGRMSAARAVHVAQQIARGLREAHALGTVHRDIKPGNVFLLTRDDDPDFVKVLDFGLVKQTGPASTREATRGGQVMGSPRYMAPEQVEGKDVDRRTDVYAVGATLYAMLAGRAPFERATDLATMMAHVAEAPPPIHVAAPEAVVPIELEAVVMRCLAKRPEDRFGSMDELLAALRLPSDAPVPFEPRPPVLEGPITSAVAPPPPSITPARAHVAVPQAGDAAAARASLAPAGAAGQPATARRSGRLWIAIGAVGLAALAAGAGLLAGRSWSASPATRPSPGPSVGTPAPGPAAPPRAAPPAVSAAPAASAAPSATATIHVETDPPGARVKEEGDVLCDATPCDVAYAGDAAAPGAEHLLVFLKAGYKIERKIAHPGARPLHVKLTPAL